MPFYFLRFPSKQTFLLGVLGTGTAVAAFEAWNMMKSRRNAVPLFNSAAVVRTEESARYPCERLRGFDVVVRSYYVPTDAPASSSSSSSSTSLSTRLQQFVDLFSNSTHTMSSSAITSDERDNASSVRLVVRDAKDAAVLPPRRTEGEDASCVIAASQWPSHTAKYAALVLAPSARDGDAASREGSGSGGSSEDRTPSRSLLRQLADGATHQSLVRCNPRSTQLDMACEGDPAYLGAPYLRVLLSGFLLLPSTLSQLNVAVLGVGGGSLPLFLQHYFASRLHRCDLVDIEPMCFKAAVEQLGLKETLNSVALRREGGGVHYHVEDAVHYLQRRAGSSSSSQTVSAASDLQQQRHPPEPLERDAANTAPSTASLHGSVPVFGAPPPQPATPSHASASLAFSPSTSSKRQQQLDLLFVDLFVGSELDDTVTSIGFLELCRGALSPYGVAAFNLPAADKAFVQRCGVVFGGRNVFRIPVPASSNEVVLVRGGAESRSDMVGPELSHRHLYRRAQELSAQYRLPYDLASHYPVWWRLW